jgi:hypothetical protein
MANSASSSYALDRDELLRLRRLRLLTNDRDYVFFALQIDYPNKLHPKIEITAFCERWELSDGNLYKALGELRQKGIIVSIASHLDLEFQSS